MGISPGWLHLFADLLRGGELRPGDAILDVGASELFCATEPESLNDLLAAAGAPAYAPQELATMADRAYARGLFERAGFPYAAIDYADFPGVLRLDLNTDALPLEHHGRYRFVNNAGTSEHILNQWNVFKVMHDAAAPGALMYHGVPGWGDFEHGIFEYSPKFFLALAQENRYEIVKYWAWCEGRVETVDVSRMFRVEFSSAPVAEKVWLHVLLRKTSDRPFAGLSDPFFSRADTVPGGRVSLRSHSLPGRLLRKGVRAAVLSARRYASKVLKWTAS
jgi:hypothetical protein